MRGGVSLWVPPSLSLKKDHDALTIKSEELSVCYVNYRATRAQEWFFLSKTEFTFGCDSPLAIFLTLLK